MAAIRARESLEPPVGAPVEHRSPPGRRPSTALGLAGAAVAAAALLPAAYLVVRTADGGFGELVRTLSSASTLGLLLRTSLLALAVTSAAVAIAVPLAWLTVRTDLPGRRVWVVLTTLPLVVPSYVGGYAFVAALGPRGIVQGWLAPLGVERLPSIYGFGGAWLTLTLFTYPYVLLTVRSAVRGLDPSLEEVARSLGDGPRRAFFRATLPQLRPAIVSGGLLVALYTLSDFGAVSLLRFDSFTRAIYVSYQASFDRTHAATLALVLALLTGIVLVAETRTRGRAAYHRLHGAASRRPQVTHLGKWRWPVLAALAVLVTFALLVPVGVIGLWLVRGIRASEPLRLTFSAAAHSLQASALGAAVSVVAAWPVALLAVRHRGRLARLVERASFTGYALPGIVVALSLVFFGARYAPALYQTRATLTFSYVVLFLPLAVGALRSSLLQVNPALEEAARSLGSSPTAVLRKIVLPLVRPGVLAAFALVFLTAMKELPATLLLAPIGFDTLATQVWSATSEAFFARAAAPALALIVLASAPLAVLVTKETKGR